MVGSTGCTSLVFPHVGIHNIHSLFGNQNAIVNPHMGEHQACTPNEFRTDKDRARNV